MPKSALFDLKISGFTGIQENVNPFSDKNSVLRSKNLLAHEKPGILSNRPPYYLKYEVPTDPRLEGVGFVSFDNFYESVSNDGVEVTIEVQKAQIKPSASISGVSYRLNSPIFWMRPHFNGVYWDDSWKWMNETIISKIITGPDATYRNQIVIQGLHGNLIQSSIVNVTKDSTLPFAVLESLEGATNTTLWISSYDTGWNVNDVVVIMLNYIPLKYLPEMYKVDSREISFHRLPSKIRIGFGGKAGRIAVGLEYVNSTIQISNYPTPHAPILTGNELLWASLKRMIVQPYTQLNEEKKDFGLNIVTDTGSFAAGKYYFRLVAVLDGLNQILVAETSLTTLVASKFFPIPWIRSGSISRRLTSLEVYFGEDNGSGQIDYYFFKEYPVSIRSSSITEGDWNLMNDGTLVYAQTASIDTDIYTETSSAHDPADNAVGSWTVNPVYTWEEAIVTGTAGSYYLTMRCKTGEVPGAALAIFLPPSGLDVPIKANRPYTFSIKFKGSLAGTLLFGYMKNDINQNYLQFPVTVADQTVTFDLISPDIIDTDVVQFVLAFYGASFAVHDGLSITSFSVKEKQTNFLDTDWLPGALDSLALGYYPSFNIVKDWSSATVLRGKTIVGAGFIEKKYSSLIFLSPISGDGNSQYDVLIAGIAYDVNENSFKGESVIALEKLLNTQLIALTDGGGAIINPETLQAEEVASGYGILTKESLRVYRGILYWGSTEDFVKMSPSNGYDAVPIDEDSVRGYYKRSPDKTLVSACIDQFGSYHVSLGAAAVIRELILTARGWFDMDRDHYPQIMRNGFLGVVWFMDPLGNIYSGPSILPEDVGYADIYGDYRSGW